MRIGFRFLFLFSALSMFTSCLFESKHAVIESSSSQGESQRFLDAKAVLQNRCVSCHQPGGAAAFSNFALNTELQFLRAGLVTAQDVDASKIIYRSMHYRGPTQGQRNMPPRGDLTRSEYNILVDWVENIGRYESPYSCQPSQNSLNSLAETNAKRLSLNQYENTLKDLLALGIGVSAATSLVDQSLSGVYLPSDTGTHFTRENNSFTGEHLNGFFNLADRISEEIATNHADRFVRDMIALNPGSCTQPNPQSLSAACRTRLIENFGLRAFRRPLRKASDRLTTANGQTIDELASFGVEFSGVSFNEGLNNLIFRVLIAPSFLFHIEDQNMVRAQTQIRGVYSLSSYAIASRLSYRFWNSMPDTYLLSLAATEDLQRNSSFEKAMTHVLASPKLGDSMKDYMYDWLHLSRTPQFSRNERFDLLAGNTNFDSSLRASMIQEIQELGSHVARTGGGFQELFTSNQGFNIDEDLMTVYGVTARSPASSANPGLVSLPADERAGILTRAALLISGSEITNPILRGAHLRKDILCLDLGSPPDDALSEFQNTHVDYRLSTREKVDIKTSGPACVGCHNLINPLGFALSNFDALGHHIEQEPIFNEAGEFTNAYTPVRSDVNLSQVLGGAGNVRGAIDYSRVLSEQESAKSCFTEKFTRFVLARAVNPENDACQLDAVFQNLAPGRSLKDAMSSLILGPEFRHRRIGN